jgi:hypothetical protein
MEIAFSSFEFVLRFLGRSAVSDLLILDQSL